MRVNRLAHLCTVLLGVAWASLAAAQLPSFEQVKASYLASDAFLYDAQGVPLADLRFDPHVRRFDWVPLERFSPALREALIVSEDHRFYEHDGVDWRAFAGAIWHNLWHQNRRGASTLTMQLAGLLDPAIAMPNEAGKRRSLGQKWDQGLAAQEMEAHWSKAQILEAYLNLAPFRGDLQGVHAASAVLFGKSPEVLDRSEALLLTAILPSPNAHAKRIALRACARAQVMKAEALCKGIEHLAPLLDTPRNRPLYMLAPHLARRLLHQGGEHVTTTLDAHLQQTALEALQAAAPHDPQPYAAGALILDNADASVRAWVGNGSAEGEDLLTLRSAWPQTALLFAAGQALEKRELTAATLLPVGVEPERSWRSLRLIAQQPESGGGASLFDPSNDSLAERLHTLGFDTPRESLPGIEASPLQWTQALRPIVNGGQYQPLHWLAEGVPAKRVWRGDTAFLLADFLADATGPRAPVLADVLRAPTGWVAVWTGASADGSQSLVVALCERYSYAILVQGRRGQPESNQHLALRALRELFARAGPALSRPPRAPQGLVNSLVAFEPPVEPPRKEWFLRGTEVTLSRPAELTLADAPAILSPRRTEGPVVLAEDESVELEATPAARDAHWRIDGAEIGQGLHLGWLPAKGHHHIELRSPSGVLWDERDLDVLTTSSVPSAQASPSVTP